MNKHQICISLTDEEWQQYEEFKKNFRQTSNGITMEPYNSNLGKFLFLQGMKHPVPVSHGVLINKEVKNAK